MSLCSWNSSNGTSCRFPGPFSSGTHGDSRYYCPFHWALFSKDAFFKRMEGDAIVRRSIEWDGKTESYLALRAEAAKSARAFDGSAKAGEKSAQQGKDAIPSELRNEPGRNEGVSSFHVAMAGMGGFL